VITALMRVIPVLDLMRGTVVRGVGGRRHEYRPIVSRLTTSPDPLDMARAFREQFGLGELYVADLDAIAGAEPAAALYDVLRHEGFVLWVDAGLGDATEARALADTGVEGIVMGLETVRGPDELARAAADVGARVVLSLDLKGGEPMGNCAAWRQADARGIAAEAVQCGVRRLLVLDLLRVGERGGLGTEDLCRTLAADHPQVELAAGGGVRDVADLRRLRDCGVTAALVASALHDGALLRPDLDALRAPVERC
jgi:phosphoribosylformimino-5-aminoimidazole carboxamide ribotide isomerase